jgi:electron transfer flavoprotein beta subunit
MKILVAIKRVVDYKAIIRVKPDGSGVDTSNTKMSMNPFDEIAVEEAVRIKEKNQEATVTVVSIGADNCQEILRTALAMGADKALLIKTESEVQPLAAAKILKALVDQEIPDLVMLGKQSIDTDNNQVGQMLAGLLNIAQGTFASKLELKEGKVFVTREVDGGLETLSLKLPAVITTDLRLNEPRYISLPNIVQAQKSLRLLLSILI